MKLTGQALFSYHDKEFQSDWVGDSSELPGMHMSKLMDAELVNFTSMDAPHRSLEILTGNIQMRLFRLASVFAIPMNGPNQYHVATKFQPDGSHVTTLSETRRQGTIVLMTVVSRQTR